MKKIPQAYIWLFAVIIQIYAIIFIDFDMSSNKYFVWLMVIIVEAIVTILLFMAKAGRVDTHES